uniref:Uncharacterized protein n=1 Tax=Arundo donax TaxID=35708 RepID=A0A0A9EL00_ARUDO
MHANDWDLPS